MMPCNDIPDTASEMLIRAKQTFGRFGQHWIRGTYKRKGWLGEGYCSLGALRQIAPDLWGHIRPQNKVTARAMHYLCAAMRSDNIAHWNDTHSWHDVKAVWCKAIELALDDEEGLNVQKD